jgi:hypothetical protein
MFLAEAWEATVNAPVSVLVERLRNHVIEERFFSKREGTIQFHGTVSEAGFSLIPVVVQLVVRSVNPRPVHILGRFEPCEEGTKVRAELRVTDIVYWAGGAFALALLGMLVYSIAVVPEVTILWLVVYIPMALFVIGYIWLWSWVRLRASKRLLQEVILGGGKS